MIKITNLSKKYGNFKALKSISFKIDQGEIVVSKSVAKLLQ